MIGIDWTCHWDYETKLELKIFKKAAVISESSYKGRPKKAWEEVRDGVNAGITY